MALSIDLKSGAEESISLLLDGQTKGVLTYVADESGKNIGYIMVKTGIGLTISQYKLTLSNIKIIKNWDIQLEEGKEIANFKFSTSGKYLVGTYQKASKKMVLPQPFKSMFTVAEKGSVTGIFVAQLSTEKINGSILPYHGVRLIF
ncbi:MAG: hypothetical protein SGJ10_09495 [Bacteroidota bacterium]|nr:hypothetical protein [Bacteroidota bacterium]